MQRLLYVVRMERVVMGWMSGVRYASTGVERRPRQKSSRTSKVHELHRRLAEFEREESERRERGEEKSRWTVESDAAETFMRANSESFSAVFRVREEERNAARKREEEKEEQLQKEEAAFPFRADSAVHVEEITPSSSSASEDPSSSVPLTDRGFFISGNMYMDEYTEATLHDIPLHEGEEEDHIVLSSREYHGPEDAVEAIDFQMPGQSVSQPRERAGSSSGGVDESELTEEEMTSERRCSGCGANFHCKDDALPGYLPPILFAREEKRAMRGREEKESLCKRCHLVKNHHFLPNVNVCPVDYASMLSQLRGRQEVLIVLVVDIVDLPASIHRALPSIIGRGKPMIVVANKVDLLPPDARCGYLKRFKLSVEKAIGEAGFADAFNILHTALVSAKTGYGIEDLITEIHVKWSTVRSRVRDDMYIVGCTNAGKSTLFNALLQSDLCKVRAVDLVERATTSIWPGTTLSLLKFPVMQPSPYKLELRRRRLLQHKAWLQKEAYARKRALQSSGTPDYAVLVEPVVNTYKEEEEELQPRAVVSLLQATSDEGEEGAEDKRGRPWSLNDRVFTKGKWCYDTPGTVNEEQILDKLSLRELVNVVPRTLLKPRTALVPPGHSLLIGAIARLDVHRVEVDRPVWITTFANDALPLNVLEKAAVEEFLKKNSGRSALGAPLGDAERLRQLGAMVERRMSVREEEEMRTRREREGQRKDETLCGLGDVVFSSIGWSMISTHALNVEVSAWLPGGTGLALRTPSILPYAAQLRGTRIPGTNLYKVRAPQFPVNVRRLEAEKNRRRFKLNNRRHDRNDGDDFE